MQLPLDLKWRQARNKRSLLWLYGTLALALMLAFWSLPRLMNGLVSSVMLLLAPESRHLILGAIGTGSLAIGTAIILGQGAVTLWRFITTHIWQIPKRYATAIERLSNEQIESRLEGIRTLKHIAKLAVKEQGTITKTLVGFVQERASLYPRSTARAWTEAQTIATDIQAALTVIGRKPLLCRIMWQWIHKAHQQEDQPINIGLTNLSQAWLRHANLREANLYKTNLQGADLCHINLQKANLQGADLKACSLSNANLQEANLQNSDLQEANLHKTNLRKANLYSANLRGGLLSKANLQEASLQTANLQVANLKGANLKGAFLYGANLQETNLQSVNLQGAFLTEANLQGTNLYKANLQGVTGLTDTQLSQANLCMTILPDGSISNRNCTVLSWKTKTSAKSSTVAQSAFS